MAKKLTTQEKIVLAGHIERAKLLNDPRNLGTILAALRYWQRRQVDSLDNDDDESSGGYDYDGCYDVATDGGTVEPLTPSEIDRLCEELN